MYHNVLHFWFKEIKPSKWWLKNKDFDKLIKKKFKQLYESAVKCELYNWRNFSKGRLAEIIILYQFSRNMFRDTPKAFESDSQALCLAQQAISLNIDKELNVYERLFLYMPFMHSESLTIQELSIKYFETLGLRNNLDYAKKHYKVIKRFNRFPHRNKILKRESSVEEINFLKLPGSRF